MSRRKRTGKGKAGKSTRRNSRRLSLIGAGALLSLLAVLVTAGDIFVHQSRQALADAEESWPRFLVDTLYFFGNPAGDITDALGWTGHDVVYTYDEEAPSGQVLFAGEPTRVSAPAPSDITVLDRGEFKIGWSPSLRHPVWVAYHVTPQAPYQPGKRPNFMRDASANRSPSSGMYDKTGYDRGHLAPNFAIASRFGEEMQRATFLMSNIAPQSPQLNRGVWRDVEHRIAELWSARWGEIWVIAGCVPSSNSETLSGSDIDVPEKFYQLIVAQEGFDIRALALVFGQDVSWGAWPTRHIVTIDELEAMTGLDFLPQLPSFIQDPLEAELPTRLWPVRLLDIVRQIALRFN